MQNFTEGIFLFHFPAFKFKTCSSSASRRPAAAAGQAERRGAKPSVDRLGRRAGRRAGRQAGRQATLALALHGMVSLRTTLWRPPLQPPPLPPQLHFPAEVRTLDRRLGAYRCSSAVLAASQVADCITKANNVR